MWNLQQQPALADAGHRLPVGNPECPNCGSRSSENDQLNNYVCRGCGNMWSDVALDIATTASRFGGEDGAEGPGDVDENGVAKVLADRRSVRRKSRSAPYTRRAHLMERVASATLQDPTVPEEDNGLIYEQYLVSSRRNWFTNARLRAGYIRKPDIQHVLRSLDHQHATSRFTIGYLEKWKSIKYMILERQKICTPADAPKYSLDLVVNVCLIFLRFSALWDRWNPSSRKEDRENRWKFKDRKHFPNFNFMFRLIHRILGVKQFDADFPLPKTPTSLKNCRKYAAAMCRELNVPPELVGLEEPKKYKQLALGDFHFLTGGKEAKTSTSTTTTDDDGGGSDHNNAGGSHSGTDNNGDSEGSFSVFLGEVHELLGIRGGEWTQLLEGEDKDGPLVPRVRPDLRLLQHGQGPAGSGSDIGAQLDDLLRQLSGMAAPAGVQQPAGPRAKDGAGGDHAGGGDPGPGWLEGLGLEEELSD